MNKSFTIGIASILLSASLYTGAPFADERVTVIEMADCNVLTFPMTEAEAAAKDAANAKLRQRYIHKQTKPLRRVVTFEMGEGGHTISFPMTKEEIAAADAERARLDALAASKKRTPESAYQKIELPESGNEIVFPVTVTRNLRPGDMHTAKGGRQ